MWAWLAACSPVAPAGRVQEPLVQHGGVDPAGVGLLGQPVAQALGGEPVGAVLGIEAGQERQGDLGVDVGEQAHGAGEDVTQVRPELVGRCDTMFDQVLAGPAGPSQRDGGLGVGDQRPQPGPVGAQRVGQDVGVESVVLVTGRAVAAAQVLDLVRADHHHRQAGGQEGVDDRTVGAFDGDLADAVLAQCLDQLAQAGGGVLDRASIDLTATAVDDREGMVIAGPVHSRGHVRWAGTPAGASCRRRWTVHYFGALLADFTSASSLLDPVGRHPRSWVSLVPGRVCRFAH